MGSLFRAVLIILFLFNSIQSISVVCNLEPYAEVVYLVLTGQFQESGYVASNARSAVYELWDVRQTPL